MELEFVPLLRIQRDLYRLPRGLERFREYLRTMVDETSGAHYIHETKSSFLSVFPTPSNTLGQKTSQLM